MSGKAILTLSGDTEKYDLIAVSFAISRSIDDLGQPASEMMGGTINCEIEASKANSKKFFEWMNNSFMQKDGSITFEKRNEDSKFQELEFKKAFCVGYNQSFSSVGSDPFNIDFTITAWQVKMGSCTLENEWPGQTA